jgi:hypothetical protein
MSRKRLVGTAPLNSKFEIQGIGLAFVGWLGIVSPASLNPKP